MARMSVLVMVTLAAMAGAAEVESGLPVGEYVAAWNPIHVAGPHRGTNACPICTYLERPALQIFVKDSAQAAAWANRLEKLVRAYEERELKGFLIVTDGEPKRLKSLAVEAGTQRSSLCYPASDTKTEDLGKYRIHPGAKTTVLLYRDYQVAARFVDLDAKDFDRVEAAVRRLLP